MRSEFFPDDPYYYDKYPNKQGYLLLSDGTRHPTTRGVACPNSRGMREWHCPETSLNLSWHTYNHITHNQETGEIHCFQCGGILGKWIEEGEEN